MIMCADLFEKLQGICETNPKYTPLEVTAQYWYKKRMSTIKDGIVELAHMEYL